MKRPDGTTGLFAEMRFAADHARDVALSCRAMPQHADTAGAVVDNLRAAVDRFNAAVDRWCEFVEVEIDLALAPPFPPYGSLDRPIPYVPTGTEHTCSPRGTYPRAHPCVACVGSRFAVEPRIVRGEFDQSEIGGEG